MLLFCFVRKTFLTLVYHCLSWAAIWKFIDWIFCQYRQKHFFWFLFFLLLAALLNCVRPPNYNEQWQRTNYNNRGKTNSILQLSVHKLLLSVKALISTWQINLYEKNWMQNIVKNIKISLSANRISYKYKSKKKKNEIEKQHSMTQAPASL